MRWSWILLLPLLLAAPAQAQRSWTEDPIQAPTWDGRTEVSLGCDSGELSGYAQGTGWADEVQVCFELPHPAEGGPWLIEYVAVLLSGSGSHTVRLRRASAPDEAPGSILAEDLLFTPVYAQWPPQEWTYISVNGSAAYPQHLPCTEGECISVGFELRSGDAIGLAADDDGGRGWSLVGGRWVDDGDLGVAAAVRIGLIDLGVSQATQSTWGQIKDLFMGNR